MCSSRNCCCHHASSDDESVLVAFFAGIWWLVRFVVAPLVKYVLAPAVAIAAVLAWRWFCGAALTGKARPASFLHGAVPPARPARRFAVRIAWAYWPGWQRAIVRWVATGLVVAGLMWPAATIAAVVSVVLAAVAMRYRFAIATRVRSLRPRPAVVRVTAQVSDRAVPALSGSRDEPVWSTATSGEAVTR